MNPEDASGWSLKTLRAEPRVLDIISRTPLIAMRTEWACTLRRLLSMDPVLMSLTGGAGSRFRVRACFRDLERCAVKTLRVSERGFESIRWRVSSVAHISSAEWPVSRRDKVAL
jgi:hypothetical protein